MDFNRFFIIFWSDEGLDATLVAIVEQICALHLNDVARPPFICPPPVGGGF